jgi:hypothetical protein
MRGRFGTWVVLAWAIAWFGAVLPGHQRGAVQLPEGRQTAAGHATASQVEPAIGCPMCAGGDSPDAPSDAPPRGRCALCQLLATLDVPPAVVLTCPPLERVWHASVRPASQVADGRQAPAAVAARPPPVAELG